PTNKNGNPTKTACAPPARRRLREHPTPAVGAAHRPRRAPPQAAGPAPRPAPAAPGQRRNLRAGVVPRRRRARVAPPSNRIAPDRRPAVALVPPRPRTAPVQGPPPSAG